MNIVLAGIHYPFAILSYFRRALERRDDIELFTVGPYTSSYIPWNGGMHLPQHYVKPVDLPLPGTTQMISWKQVGSYLPFRPDLVLVVDAGFHFSDKPDCKTAYVATDPHVLSYDHQRQNCDFFFNMQKCYSKPGDIYLPYAADPTCHFPEAMEEKYDAALIGLHYPQRDLLVNRLREMGLKVNYDLGLVFDEYRRANCAARIGLNWSSLNDMTARVFEIMAMNRVPVINRVPDLSEVGLLDGIHYLGFDNLDEAIAKVRWALDMPKEAQIIADNAYKLVSEKHTYDLRISQILETCL